MKTLKASQKQKAFFADLERVPGLVLSLKHDEASALNAHGRFRLLNKAWPNGDVETLLAFMPPTGSDPEMTRPGGEPVVHLHVDWSLVRYAQLNNKNLPKIGTTKELLFSATPTTEAQVFTFYSKKTPELMALINSHGGSPIDLTERSAK